MANEVSYQPTVDDLSGALRDSFVLRLRGSSRPPYLSASWPIGAAVLAGLIVLAQVKDTSALVAVLMAYALLVPAWWGASYLLMSRPARKLFAQQRTLHRQVRYRWSADNLAFWSDGTHFTLAWADLHGWREGRHAFLFMPNGRVFYFVPKRVLTSELGDDLRRTVRATALPEMRRACR
jgi:hypothetical protein